MDYKEPQLSREDAILAAIRPQQGALVQPEATGVPNNAGEDFVPKSRFDELLERTRAAEAQRDRLTEAQISGRFGGPAIVQPPRANVDQETRETVQPLLEEFRGNLMDEFRPMLQWIAAQAGQQEVNRRMPGSDEVQAEAKRRWAAMTPEEQAMHDNPVGMRALIGDILWERAQGGGTPGGLSDPSRSHSVPRGTSTPAPTRGNADLVSAIRDPNTNWEEIRSRMFG